MLYKIQMLFRTDENFKKRLEHQAERLKISVSSIIRMGTIKLLEEYEREEESKA